MQTIKKRIPSIQEIIPVYAVATTMLFGWMLILFFWNLPSWMKFMPMGQLFSVLSYSVMVTFIQTILVMAPILIVAFLAPAWVFRSDFTVRGAIAVAVFLAMIFLRAVSWLRSVNFLTNIPSLFLISSLITVGLAFLSARLHWLRKLVASAADLLIIFLFPLVPLIVLATLTVIIRNLA